MFRSYRLIIFALGLTISLSPEVSYAQQSEEQNGQRQTQADQNPPANPGPPFRVIIVEDQSKTDTRQASEERSEQRELQDLTAQKGMNEATKKMADYSIWQTILIAIGTSALLITLYLTRQANKAAMEGAKAAQLSVTETSRIGEAQVRAYLSGQHGRFEAYEGFLNITLVIVNTGQSPAYNVKIAANLTTPDIDNVTDQPWLQAGVAMGGYGACIAAQTQEEFMLLFGLETVNPDILKVIHEGRWFNVDSEIVWEDVFGIRNQITAQIGESASEYVTNDRGFRYRGGSMKAGNRHKPHPDPDPDPDQFEE